MTKILNTKSLTKKLDRIFSEYIRRFHSKDGVTKCVTCNKMDVWQEMDAGHYISRSHLNTRFDERNVWPQCKSCNRFHEGRKDEYALFLINKYGPDILKDLNQDKWKPVFTFPYDEMIALYKDKLKDIKGV